MRHAEGKPVRGIRAVDRGMLRSSSPSGLGRALSGRRFAGCRRHGKLLVCPTDGPALLLHFGMTGTLVWSGDDHHGLVPGKRTWLTGARDRRGAACPRCGTLLARVRVGGRTTVFCPDEQT